MTKPQEIVSTQPDISLDVSDLVCPMTIVKAREVIRQLQVGQVMEIYSDRAGLLQEMASFCRATGHHLLKIQEKERDYRVWVRKGTI